MRTISNSLTYPSQSFPERAWIALLAFVTVFVCAAGVSAQTKPPIVVSQTSWLTAFPSGRAISSGNAAGTSFGVNSSGDVLIDDTYGYQVLLFNGQTGALTVLGTGLSSAYSIGAVTVDSQNNLYIGGLNQPYIAKIPYNNGAYSTVTTPTNTMTACTGNDTTECLWGSNLRYSGNNYAFGVVSMAFDSKGDFFFATDGVAGTGIYNPYSIFECSAACVATAGTGAGAGVPTLIYTEPTPTPSTVTSNAQGIDCATNGSTVQVAEGSLAIDPSGNLFFNESALDTCGSVGGAIDQSDYSDIKELPTSSGAPYTATTLYTYTPFPTPGAYDDEVDGIATDANGTVYFTTQYDGIFAFANNGTPFTTPPADIYSVSVTGSKVLALDTKGNAYVVASIRQSSTGNYVDTLGRVSINNLSVPASPVGTASTTGTTVDVMDDGVDCSSNPTLTITTAENGAASSEFSGATSGACAPELFGSYFPVTITAIPTNVGERSALLTATDSSSNTGTAIASTVGQGALVTLDQGNTPTAYTGFTSPAGISVNATGDLFVADAGANKVDEIAAGTMTAIGSGFNSPSGTALDANGDLYIADTGNNQIVEITSPGSPTAVQSTAVASTLSIGGTTLNGPTGLAMGPDGVLYIADTGNNRVVTYSPENNLAGVRTTGLSIPLGIAVDAADNLYVANEGSGGSGSGVQVYSTGGSITTLTPPGVTVPVGVAVDASGSVLISDQSTGNIVRVPNEAGTLTPADAVVIEKNPQSGAGLALDVAGNLYTTDLTGKTAYAIQRTESTINFGSVNDGSSSAPVTVYAESAGNTALALASGMTSFLTAPSSTMFTLAAGSPVDCTTATSVASGTACEFTAQFSPALGTASGTLSATADFDSTALNAAAAPITMNGTAVYVALPVAATPTFTPAAGTYTSAQSVTISDATTGTSIYYTTDGSTPTTSSTLYSGAVTVSSTETINAIAVATGYANSLVGSATYTINITPPSFTISLASSSLTVTAGQSGTDMVTVTPLNGFNSAVTFACTGLPSGATCSFSPTPVTPSGGAASTTQLTITTTSTTAALRNNLSPLFPGSALACVLCCFLGYRKRRSLQMMLLIAVGLVGLGLVSGCGVHTNPSYPSNVTVNATSGSLVVGETFGLTVQN